MTIFGKMFLHKSLFSPSSARTIRQVLIFFVFIMAFIVVRNMFYMLVSDSVSVVADEDNVNSPVDFRIAVAQESNLPNKDGEVLFSSTTVVNIRDIIGQLHLTQNQNRTGSYAINGSLLDLNILNETMKRRENDGNHTLLKANMSHVGDIVKQLKEDNLKKVPPVKFAKPHPFKYIINSPNICGEDKVFILCYIHTAPDHHKRRTVIRQTWGKMEQYSVPMRLVFFMGLPSLRKDVLETDEQKALFFESEQYGDIVQEDFLDSYHNLTHKGVTAFKWISNYCRQAIYVVKTDDDIFVNTYTVIRHLSNLYRKNDTKGILMCAVWYQMTVLREGKWKVTKEEWPESTYPTYCSGSAFILSTDVVVRLHEVSYHVPFFWVDDFYLTGLLPLKAGNITHRSFGSTFVLNGDLLEEKFTGPMWYMYTFSHLHSLNRIQSVWDKMTKLAKGLETIVIQTALPGQLMEKDRQILKDNPL